MYKPWGIKLAEEGHFFSQFIFLFTVRVDVALVYDVCVLLMFVVDGKLYVFQVHCHFQL
jgi:hypothetical protein